LVAMIGFLPDSVTQRVEETQQTGKHGEEEIDVSTASRWEIWGGAMGVWRDHPLGAGLNRFKKEIGSYCHYKGYDAHDFYVLTLAETGPQGLIAYLYLFGSIVMLSRWLRKHAPPEDSELQALTIGFSVATICMMMGGLYGSPHFDGNVMAPFW